MNRTRRKLAGRIAIWLVVATLVYRAGACSCQCVHHTVWFDIVGSIKLSEHECDHVHSHHDHAHHVYSHDSLIADDMATSGERCIRLSDNADLWRPDSSSNDAWDLDPESVRHIAVAHLNPASCSTTESGRLAHLHAEASGRALGVRAALQVFQL